ncbi:hypothetical protein F7725_023538 [Dissostichus mawsoni]|uniref:EF-hand domain-containing protein n=1 Tax=Dissostichus mawsoni TaxID=36200 RepID=A0A7J5Z1Z3_DISMA|nr:hypothetical protein F7725_023538 [Dissostichus mawsoni]
MFSSMSAEEDSHWLDWVTKHGSIDPDELRTVLKSCLRESAISLPEEKLDDLTLALFESADKDNSGSITFEELKAELRNLPRGDGEPHHQPPAVDPQKRRGAPRYLTQAYWQNNSRKLLFLVLYALLNLTLFLGAVLMLLRRASSPGFRATWVVRVLPLDQNILLHQIVGYAIPVFTTAHTTAHIFNFALGISADHAPGDRLGGGGGLSDGDRPAAGHRTHGALLQHIRVLLVSPVLCVGVSVLMVHCSNFWKWFVVPGLMFLLEKIVGMAVSRMGGLYIVEVNMLPSKGDYVYINIPAIAKYEWHPFTISSPPSSQNPGGAAGAQETERQSEETQGAEEFFSSTDCNGVASNEDEAIELKMYRQRGLTPPPDPQAPPPYPAEPPPDRLEPAERGEAPPLREVPAKLGENHRVCNIKTDPMGPPRGRSSPRACGSDRGRIGITPFASILQSIMYRPLPGDAHVHDVGAQ